MQAANQAKEVAHEAWLQNKVDSSLHTRCTGALKAGTPTVKSSKCNLSRVLDITWIPIAVLADLQSVMANNPPSSRQNISYC